VVNDPQLGRRVVTTSGISSTRTSNYHIRWHCGIKHLPGALDTSDGQILRVEQTELDQHRGLVPINVLMSQFAIPNRTTTTSATSTRLSVGRTPGSIQSSSTLWVNLMTISSTSWSLPDGSRDRDHLHVRGHSRDEMRRVEFSQLGFATAAGQHRNMIDVGVLDHRGERVFGATGLKFMPDVIFPKPR
jgi:hypothetical protein